MTNYSEWKDTKYPEPLSYEVGHKVSWYTYKTLPEAKKAADQAAIDREIALDEGYDFGYLWPSTIRKNEDGTFTVVIP